MVGKSSKSSAEFAMVALKLWTIRPTCRANRQAPHRSCEARLQASLDSKVSCKRFAANFAGIEVVAVEKVDEALDKRF
jgi:hypothetical protein